MRLKLTLAIAAIAAATLAPAQPPKQAFKADIRLSASNYLAYPGRFATQGTDARARQPQAILHKPLWPPRLALPDRERGIRRAAAHPGAGRQPRQAHAAGPRRAAPHPLDEGRGRREAGRADRGGLPPAPRHSPQDVRALPGSVRRGGPRRCPQHGGDTLHPLHGGGAARAAAAQPRPQREPRRQPARHGIHEPRQRRAVAKRMDTSGPQGMAGALRQRGGHGEAHAPPVQRHGIRKGARADAPAQRPALPPRLGNAEQPRATRSRSTTCSTTATCTPTGSRPTPRGT